MKKNKKSIFVRIVAILSFVVVFLLILSYLLPFIEPKTLKSFASFSLFTPLIMMLNIVFLIYWMIKMERIFWLHFIVILIGFPYFTRFYKISGEKIIETEDVKIMSYNVRMFNKYKWKEDDNIPKKIEEFVREKSPQIFCIQDYAKEENIQLEYPYKFEKFQSEKSYFGQAIYSEYPIVKNGSFNFKGTANNIIWADIKLGTDTVRVYNFHLQSIKLNMKKDFFGEKDAEHLQMRISEAFHMQQDQVEEFLKEQEKNHYPKIIVGDFNNTAFSWVYRKLIKGKRDAFSKAGVGFDKSFDFGFPLRIDFILVDKKMKINYFKTYKVKYSDHFPILVRIDKNSFKDLK